MKALVTGAAGFIGSHVARSLCAAGHDVRAGHLPGEDLRNLAGLALERVVCDVTDAGAVARAVDGVDVVFHLAAIYALWLPQPQRMLDVNVGGTRTVLAAAERAGARVVYTSSIAVFGGQGPGVNATEDSPFALGATGDVYSYSKYVAHRVAVAAADRGQDVTIVAPCGPIGPGDVGPTPTGRLLLAALTMPAVVVMPTETCFADVRDMAAAHLAAADRGARGRSYLLGAHNLPLPELASRTLAVAGLRKPVWSLPRPLVGAGARALVGVARVTGRAPLVTPAAVRIARLGLRANCQRAARELGLRVRPIEDSLRDAVTWFRDNGYAPRANGHNRRPMSSPGSSTMSAIT